MGMTDNFFGRFNLNIVGPSAQAAVAPTTAGAAFTITRLLGTTSVLSLLSGGNSNLTVSNSTGIISTTTAIPLNTVQTSVVREENGFLAIEYPVTLTGSAPIVTSSPSLSLSNAVVQAEGNSGTSTFSWTLTLNPDGSTDSFPYTWSITGFGGNPANAADFGGTLPSGSGTFASGETSKNILVLVTGDTAVEPNDAFTLTVTGTGLNTVTSTGTISNDDVAAPVYGVTSIDPEGYIGQYNLSYAAMPTYSTSLTEFDPDGSNTIQIPLQTLGYDNNCNAETFSRSVVITKRYRKTWTSGGNHLTADGNRVTFDKYVLSTCTTPSGITNNSTKLGYQPIAQHLVRNRRVVGDSTYVQIGAGHWSARNKQPVAGVKAWYRSVDGTKSTNKVVLSGPKQLVGEKDRHCVIGYDGNIPTATWSDGSVIADGTPIIREAEVFPHFGTLIATTVGKTVDAQGFTPWTDYKHTARATNPPTASRAPTGGNGVDETVNANGVGTTTGLQKISTDPAVSRANPFATETSAIQALKLATAITGGFTDGCVINMRAGNHTQGNNTTAQTYQQGGELIIQTDPIDATYSAILTLTGYASYRQTWLAWRKMTLVKNVTASGLMSGGRILDCKIDGGGFNSSFFTGLALINGAELTNFPVGAGALMHSTNGSLLMRGVLASDINLDCYNLSGSRLKRCSIGTGSRTKSGMMFNGVSNLGGVVSLIATDGATTVEGVALLNTIYTWAITTGGLLITASADNHVYDIKHFLRLGVTELGSSDKGRRNEGYDETDGTVRRNNEFWVETGVIAAAAYHKVDWFCGTNKPGTITAAECANRTGSHSVTYGVNRLGVFQVTEPNVNTGPNFGPGGSENRAFFGRKVKTLTNRTNAYTVYDPKFVGGYQKAVHWNGTAFVEGDVNAVAEDFLLENDSPCIGMLTAEQEALPLDIFGNARDRGSAGATR